jgi:hypothetical protein
MMSFPSAKRQTPPPRDEAESSRLMELLREASIATSDERRGPDMGKVKAELKPRCDYCGKVLVVQDEQGNNADGNRVVLEVDGSQKRACRSCADRLSKGQVLENQK